MTPQYLGTNSAHFFKNNTNNNNELIKKKNKFLTGFQLKTPRLKVIVIDYLPMGWNCMESFFSCVRRYKKGSRGWGKGGEEQKGKGKGRAVPFLQYSPQFPLLSPSFLHATKGKGFLAFLKRSVLNCSRMPSASVRIDSVPSWLLPKSCRLLVSSLLYWGGY